MRLYELLTPVTPTKLDGITHPGVKVNVQGVVFYIIAEFTNIIWKLAPGNKKVWQSAKQDKGLNFMKDVVPELEAAVYQLLSYLDNPSNTSLEIYGYNRRYKVYTLYGNTSKAANLYRTWNSPPNNYTARPSNEPKRQGIEYFRNKTE